MMHSVSSAEQLSQLKYKLIRSVTYWRTALSAVHPKPLWCQALLQQGPPDSGQSHLSSQ